MARLWKKHLIYLFLSYTIAVGFASCNRESASPRRDVQASVFLQDMHTLLSEVAKHNESIDVTEIVRGIVFDEARSLRGYNYVSSTYLISINPECVEALRGDSPRVIVIALTPLEKKLPAGIQVVFADGVVDVLSIADSAPKWICEPLPWN